MSKKNTSKKIKTTEAIRIQYTIDSIHDKALKQVEFPTSYREYDEDGNLLTDISWDHNGMLSEKYTFTYQDGKKVGENLYLDENEIAEYHAYEYDGDLITKARIKYMDDHEEYCTYYYENNRIVRKETIDDEGEDGEKETFSYEKDKLVRYEKHGDFGIEELTTQKWDGDLLIEKDQQLLLEEDHIVIRNEYNEEGLLIKNTEEKSSGRTKTESEYTYDDHKRLVEVKQIENGELHIIRYQYNEKGHEVYMEDTAQDGSLNFKVERTHDDDGNVLKSSVEIYSEEGLIEAQYSVQYRYTFF